MYKASGCETIITEERRKERVKARGDERGLMR